MDKLPTETPTTWFERVCQRLRISFFTGVLLIGSLPSGATFFVAGYLNGEFDLSTSQGVVGVLNLITFLPVPAVCLYGSRYLSRTVTDLYNYAAAQRTSAIYPVGIDRLGSLRFAAVIALPILLFTLLLPGSRGVFIGGSAGVLLSVLVPIAAVFLVLVLGTLVWVFGYSMYLVHRLASAPLTLRSFGEDRSLGLRPFGTAAFRLTLVYMGALALLSLHGNLPPLPPLYLLGFLSLFFLAIPFVLLPLRTLHRRLLTAKATELDWIGKKYGALFSVIKARNGPLVDDELKIELAALDSLRQLQRDVEQAPTWPFDTIVVTRLVAILLSVTGILASSIIRDILRF